MAGRALGDFGDGRAAASTGVDLGNGFGDWDIATAAGTALVGVATVLALAFGDGRGAGGLLTARFMSLPNFAGTAAFGGDLAAGLGTCFVSAAAFVGAATCLLGSGAAAAGLTSFAFGDMLWCMVVRGIMVI